MELFLDVDGVILDFETSFVNLVRDEYVPELPHDYVPKNWEIFKEFPDVELDDVWENFVGSERFAELDPLVEPKSFNRITERFPTYLVTNIPDYLMEKRRRNLAKYKFAYREVVPAGNWDFGIKDYPTKSQAIRRLITGGRRIVFLDDYPGNCEEVKREIPEAEVYLMSRPHNVNFKGKSWTRVKDWHEFVEKIDPSIGQATLPVQESSRLR